MFDLKSLSKASKSFKILETMLNNDSEVVGGKDSDFLYGVTFLEDSRRKKLIKNGNTNHGCIELKRENQDWLITVIDG